MSPISKIFVLLCGFLALIPDGRCSVDTDDKEWWETTLVYQILPRAFQDSNGDGIGDLRGITDRLDYIVDIGVETIRLSPFYTSPLLDSGYDISNYTEIHPLYGDLNEFDNLISEAHERGLKVILDVVPNHSSDQHDWFLSSIVNEEPYSDYYIWSNKSGSDSPPNDWKNVFDDTNGSAWTWHDVKGQWYLHRFHMSEPDFDLSNENVVNEFLDIFDFWLERGVDGFCICDVSYFFENDEIDNEFSSSIGYENSVEHDSSTEKFNENFTNAALLYKFREYINEWVKCNNSTPKYLVAEVDANDKNVMSYYGSKTDDNFVPLNSIFIAKINGTSDASEIKEIIEDWIRDVPQDTTNWLLSNRNTPRAPTRLGSRLFDSLRIITLLLPGQAHVYYGDEIAMTNSENSLEFSDEVTSRSDLFEEETETGFLAFPNDVVNTPMQWNSSSSAGFSSNESTFVPVNPDYLHNNVDDQLQETNSFIQVFKKLAALRKQSIFTHGDYELDTLNDGNVLVLRRTFKNNTCVAVINFSKFAEKIKLMSLYPDLQDSLKVVIIASESKVRNNILTYPTYMHMRVSANVFFLNGNEAIVLCSDIDVPESVTTTIDIESTSDNEDYTVNVTEEVIETTTPEYDSTESTTDTSIFTSDTSIFTTDTTTFRTTPTTDAISTDDTTSSMQPSSSTTEIPASAGTSLMTSSFLFVILVYVII